MHVAVSERTPANECGWTVGVVWISACCFVTNQISFSTIRTATAKQKRCTQSFFVSTALTASFTVKIEQIRLD